MSVQNGAFTRTNGFGPGQERTIPRFHLESILDPVASEQQGRPIYHDREEVELITPGNPYNIPNEVVNNSHKERWPKEYAAFKSGIEVSAEGTPLEQWPILRPAQIRELKHFNLMTVEHIAGMSDHACQQMMGGMRLRALAKAFLDDAESTAQLAKATADNERKDAQIADLNTKVEQLSTLLNQVHGQMQEMKNAPSALATVIPGMSDPVEQAKTAAKPVAASSLTNLPEPRRRGPKPKPRDAEGNIIRDQKVA